MTALYLCLTLTISTRPRHHRRQKNVKKISNRKMWVRQTIFDKSNSFSCYRIGSFNVLQVKTVL